jgi:four helix bundle protein
VSSEQKTVSSEQKAVNSNKPHKNLFAWQKAIDLVLGVYKVTRTFPSEEMYSLTSQLRRAAVSVASNIAEGAADRTPQQFCNFLSNSIGSLNEIDTQLYIGFRLGYLDENDYQYLHKLLDECLALTYGLKKSIRIKNIKINHGRKNL